MLTGARQNPLGCERGACVSRLVGSEWAPGIPDAWDLRYPGFRIPYQRGSSCYGNAWAQNLRTSSRGALDPSSMAPWTVARELERPGPLLLPDEGVYGYRILDAMSNFGICSLDRWPDNSPLTSRVPIDVLEAGQIAKVVGIWHFADVDITADIRKAVHQGHPVTFGMAVGRSYQTYSGSTWGGIRDADDGHAQCIVGYRHDAALVANSWGIGWGEDGCAWVSWSWLESDNCWDFQSLTTTPVSLQ